MVDLDSLRDVAPSFDTIVLHLRGPNWTLPTNLTNPVVEVHCHTPAEPATSIDRLLRGMHEKYIGAGYQLFVHVSLPILLQLADIPEAIQLLPTTE
jgi:hypothetical protein